MQGLDAIFFDLDGTLVDSAPDIQSCLFAALQEHAITADGAAARFKIGPPLDAMIRYMVPGISPERLAGVVESFRKNYDRSDYPLTVPFKGVECLFSQLALTGLPLYVATNKPLLPSKRIVAKMGWSFFEALLTPDFMEGRCFTKPQLLQFVATDRGYDPKKCIMVGDLSDDVVAARTAGFRSVIVSWGYGEVEFLANCGADWLVFEPAEIISIGKGLCGV